MAVEVQTLWSEVILAGLQLQMNKKEMRREKAKVGGGEEGMGRRGRIDKRRKAKGE